MGAGLSRGAAFFLAPRASALPNPDDEGFVGLSNFTRLGADSGMSSALGEGSCSAALDHHASTRSTWQSH